MAIKKVLIGEILVQKGIITADQLKEALEEHKKTRERMGEIFLRKGWVVEKDIAIVLSEQLGLPFVDLSEPKIDQAAISAVPREAAERLKVIPISITPDYLAIAMANPMDVDAIDELSVLSEHRIKTFVSTPTEINNAIILYYGKSPAVQRTVKDIYKRSEPQKKEAVAQVQEEATRLMEEAAQAPVIKMVNGLLEDAVKLGASDIHLEPDQDNFYCRFRIDGILHDIDAPPKKLQQAIISRIKIMAEINIAQARLPQDGRIQTIVMGREIDLRVATFPVIFGEHVAIRILDKTQGVRKISDLGFDAPQIKTVDEIIHKPYGIILVTGPTGSGKSTTLYAMLNVINDNQRNIVTLEDPVEYTISRVNQCQVNPKAGLTFASGLRSIVRLDPDIIMIGEIRDKETADIAIHSALTGHLVLSTLHTNDAPSAAARLVNIGVEPYLVGSSIISIIAQRLVRKLCVKCREAYTPTEKEMEAIKRMKTDTYLNGITFYRPKGCQECHNIGYKGRSSIFEVMIPDESIRSLIVSKSPAYKIKEAAQKAGMRTLFEQGLDRVKEGITSLSEVLRVAEEI